MSSAQERDLPPARLDLVEESRTFGYDGSDWVALAVDQNGQLDVTLKAESVSLEGDDDDGNTLAVNVETLSEGIADPDGLLTYFARALNSQGQDELRSRLHNSSGAQVDPATTALEDALQANANDEYRIRAFGPDAAGVLQAVNAEAFDTALATTDIGIATYGDRALASIAQDEVRVASPNPLDVSAATVSVQEATALDVSAATVTVTDDGAFNVAGTVSVQEATALDVSAATVSVQEATALDVSAATVPTEQQTPVGIEDSGGVQIDPATTALENALQANAADEFRARLHDSTGAQLDPLNQDALQTVANDELRARLFQPDAGGVLQQVIAEAIDTAVAATDVGLLTWDARALNSVGQDEWVARTADSAGAQQDLQQTDSAFHNGTAIAAGGTESTGLAAPGASKLRGRVVNDAQYDVDIEVLDAPGGTVLFTVNVATDVAADTETALDENLESPFINVVVTNDGGAESAMTAAYHLVGGN